MPVWYAAGVRLVKLPTSQPKSEVLASIDEMLVKRINSGKYFAVENGNSEEVARMAESSSARRSAFQSGTFQSIAEPVEYSLPQRPLI